MRYNESRKCNNVDGAQQGAAPSGGCHRHVATSIKMKQFTGDILWFARLDLTVQSFHIDTPLKIPCTRVDWDCPTDLRAWIIKRAMNVARGVHTMRTGAVQQTRMMTSRSLNSEYAAYLKSTYYAHWNYTLGGCKPVTRAHTLRSHTAAGWKEASRGLILTLPCRDSECYQIEIFPDRKAYSYTSTNSSTIVLIRQWTF